MAIKLPEEMINGQYGFDLSIPAPRMETKANKDGSFTLSACYDMAGLAGFARRIAQEMNEKIEAEIIAELLRLNGYVPERTCRAYYLEGETFPRCETCDAPMLYEPSHHLPNYCHNCGARVKEEQ